MPLTFHDDCKVLQIIDTLGMGGAETWLMEVLRRSVNSGLRIDFLCTSGQQGIFDEEAQLLGAKVFYIPFGKRKLASFSKRFRQILAAEKYDALHDHQDYSGGWHFLLGTGLLPRTRITHVHNPSYQIRDNYGLTTSRRLTAKVGKELVRRFATHLCGTSRQALTAYGFDGPQFRSIPKTVLHCGFSTGRFLGDPQQARAELCAEFNWPSDSRIILFAGRIDRSVDPSDPQAHKNAPFAVQVGIECLRRDERARLLLAGAPSAATPALQERIRAAGASGKIVLAGIRRDIERLMLAAHALLFPSREEGLGMVAVEAQASGLPVVASTGVPRECCVIPDLVDFLPLAEGPQPWAVKVLERITQVRRHPAENNARIAASAFSIEQSKRQMLELYSGQIGFSQ